MINALLMQLDCQLGWPSALKYDVRFKYAFAVSWVNIQQESKAKTTTTATIITTKTANTCTTNRPKNKVAQQFMGGLCLCRPWGIAGGEEVE